MIFSDSLHFQTASAQRVNRKAAAKIGLGTIKTALKQQKKTAKIRLDFPANFRAHLLDKSPPRAVQLIVKQ